MADDSRLDPHITAPGSDYGSEIDDETIDDLFCQAQSPHLHHLVTESIDESTFDPNPNNNASEYARFSTARLRQPSSREASVEIEYDKSDSQSFPAAQHGDRPERDQSPSEEPEVPDDRPPIERFRTRPMKPLSVTDIVSPAWCELQYWYSLTKYGRVRRTPAMKQGSGVHKVLEDQVHTHVPVEIETKEDRFALRIWNTIQGLRTLQATGLTRELEVWGLVEGEVIVGVIDEITTECPDEHAEAMILEKAQKGNHLAENGRKRKPMSADQRTLTQFLTSSPSSSILENTSNAWLGTLQEKQQSLYLKDIKTRQSKSLPSASSQLKPVQMQLMLYHRMFSALAANHVPAPQIFERYGLSSDVCFSDTFLAQMGTLELGQSSSALNSEDDDIGPPSEPRDHMDEVLNHNTLASLWQLMTSELARIAPANRISPLLTAEYRTPSTGDLLGRRTFAFNVEQLDAYVSDEMKWWKGERAVKGVDIEEAFKCRICEFAPNCQWRMDRVEEGVRKAKLRREERRKSEM